MLQYIQRAIRVFFTFWFILNNIGCNNTQHEKPYKKKKRKYEYTTLVDKCVEAYIERISNGQAWGGDYELAVIQDIIKCNIEIQQPNSGDYNLGGSGQKYGQKIKLQRVNNNHYNYILEDNKKQSHVINVPGDGNCLFRAVLGATKKLTKKKLNENKNQLDNEIKQLRINTGKALKKNNSKKNGNNNLRLKSFFETQISQNDHSLICDPDPEVRDAFKLALKKLNPLKLVTSK